MIRELEKFEIPDDNPFQNDNFDREVIANNLEKIINRTQGSLVISVDAGWGMGKTTFVKMWEKSLERNPEYHTVYFNAWENDDTDDPLISIMVSMEDELPEKDGKINKIKDVGKQLIKKSIPIALKMLTYGVLDCDKIKLGDFNEKSLVELAGNIGSIELMKHKEEMQAKGKFKEILKDYKQTLGKKIVFFIDELDRCRPTFAIETLERIKHLFDIEGFVFILSLDKSQLIHCIRTLYGTEVDSSGYLRRFIDLEYSLPEPDRELYLNHIIQKFELENDKTKLFFIPYLKGLVRIYNLSLRDINKLTYYLYLVLPMTPLYDDKKYLLIYLQIQSIVYSVFPVLRIKEYDKYHQFLNKSYNESELLEYFQKIEPKKTFKDIYYKGLNDIFIDIIRNIIKINKDILYGKMERYNDEEDYTVGLDREDEYSIIHLLDETRRKLKFIDILEFVDRFNLGD
ncbi:UNVERIFIED_CONTAM: KAP-like P-loop domain-containing protein [Acetivibrio alkalicellulosi]